MSNNFSSSLSYSGPTPGTLIPILTWVGLPDGSKYYFDYDTSYGVVTKIRYDAYAGNKRRQTTYTVNFTSTDSPRVTAERDWAASWNGDTNETPVAGEEAVTTFTHDADGGCRITLPDTTTVYKEYYGTGWQSGLTTKTKVYASVADANVDTDSNPKWKKKTTTDWTQENPNVSYLLNPRVTETNIRDSEGNRKRTTIDYGPPELGYVQYSLPYLVRDYAADGVTEIRHNYTDYNLSQQYLDRRIIGLVKSVHISNVTWWQTKITYEYDEGQINSQATNATHRDSSYNSSSGRGNVTSISRRDTTDPGTINDGSKAHTSHVTYDAAGSALTTSDALGQTTTIEYADTYAYAYPTKIKDPDWHPTNAPTNFQLRSTTSTRAR